MSLPSKSITPHSDYEHASSIINKALADMDSEGHIEYGSLIYNNNQSLYRYRQWWRTFLRKNTNRRKGSNIVSRQKD